MCRSVSVSWAVRRRPAHVAAEHRLADKDTGTPLVFPNRFFGEKDVLESMNAFRPGASSCRGRMLVGTHRSHQAATRWTAR